MIVLSLKVVLLLPGSEPFTTFGIISGANRKFRKGFQNMEVNIICANLVFMDLVNPFGVSGDVTGYINMHNRHLFTFGNTKLQYMSATTQIASK